MVIGRKPKPIHLRVIDGTHRNTRHGPKDRARKAIALSSKAFGKLTMPRHFEGHAAEAWDEYIRPCGWLDKSREPCAIVLCELYQEFREAPREFKKHSELRAYMSLLGLTDERNRGPYNIKEPHDEYFGEP
jgi:hypothetical protein